MPTTTASAALVPAVPVFNEYRAAAWAGFLAGYSGLTLHGGVPSECTAAGQGRLVARLPAPVSA